MNENKSNLFNISALGIVLNLMYFVQWNLDLTNLYITKSSVQRTILFSPVKVKCMEQNLDITNRFPQSLGSSLNRGSTVNKMRTEQINRFHVKLLICVLAHLTMIVKIDIKIVITSENDIINSHCPLKSHPFDVSFVHFHFPFVFSCFDCFSYSCSFKHFI